jgi:signal transduction histidine kinase
MKSPLNILQLEDDPADAALIQMALKNEGLVCAISRVENREDFVAALEDGLDIDLILSDFTLPSFDGLSAMGISHARWPELPFILVSGTLGEDLAVDSLKGGATDYILKNNLGRLAPAVRRAMHEVEQRAGQRRLEAQFIEAQKMEVIGLLASGVAHDFNNILAIIMFCGDLIAAQLDAQSSLRQYTDEIRLAADRASGLTRQLLIFSRNQTVQPIVLDLNDVIHDLDQMLRRLISENVEMTVLPDTALGHIKADPGYVGQVLMNLVVNARDAMSGGGKITVATSNVTLDEAAARANVGATPGEFVMMTVSDTGSGMTSEVKAHLFEAFFTTKVKGKGTGLGLATCKTIVQQSGGWIGVDSIAGRGTTFRIYFPRLDAPLDIATRRSQTGPLPRGTETLLIVEDDPAVRNLARGLLQHLGYRVLAAANGQEGLRVVRDHKGSPIQLVVTDIIMPLMGGKVMAGWLQVTHPELKVLFTSGYADDATVQSGALDPGVAFLPKPYTLGILAHTVRQMLDHGDMREPEDEKGTFDASPVAP